MLICSGKEDGNGDFHTSVIDEGRDGETAKEAITRVAKRFFGEATFEKKHEWHDGWTRLGPDRKPTSKLPALFIGRRIFTIQTRWDADAREWRIAEGE